MNRFVALFVVVFVFALGGCSTFRGLKEDAKIAASKVKGIFSKENEFTPSRQQVRKAQQLLRAEGYQSGRPGGIMGPKTVSAPKRYQSAKGLTVTGKVDPDTPDSLGVDGRIRMETFVSTWGLCVKGPRVSQDRFSFLRDPS